MKYISKITIIFYILFLIFNIARASMTDGTIDLTNKYAWGENVGWINFGTTEGNVHITTTGMTGYAWGENIGWISLNCSNTASCGTINYGVTSDNHGTLGGYAWGENVGWINFGATPTGVQIGNDGKFSDWAWGENIGWISFNCTNTNSCGAVNYFVQTDYRPIVGAANPPGGGGGGGGGGATPTATPTSTVTPPVSPTSTPVPTGTPRPTARPTPRPTPRLTPRPRVSITPRLTSVGSPTPMFAGFPTPIYSATPTPVSGGGVLPPLPSSTPLSPPPSMTPMPPPVQSGGGNIRQQIRDFLNNIIDVAKTILEIIKNTNKEQDIQVISYIGTLLTVVSSVSSALGMVSSVADVALLVNYIWLAAFELLGLRQRRRPWGVVYNSVTKEPMPLAKISILNNTGRTVEWYITDREGRFGFLVSPELQGDGFHLKAEKDSYAFPSEKVTTQTDTVLYQHVYRGEPISVYANAVVNYDLPMDPLTPEVLIGQRPAFFRFSNFMVHVMDLGFWVALVTVPLTVFFDPSLTNYIVFGIFGFFTLLRLIGFKERPFGLILDKDTGKPIPYSTVLLNDTAGQRRSFAVADATGRYVILADKGQYNMVVNAPASATTSPKAIQEALSTSTGWIKKKVTL